MKLKNEALRKLYDRLVDGPISLSVYAGVLEKPFEEVDRELTNLQNRNDILEKSNGTLLGANLDLCTKNRDLKHRNKQLEKELDEAKSSVEYFKASRNDWRSKICELKMRFDKANSDRIELQQDHESDVRVIGKLHSQMVNLEDEKTEQEKRADILKSEIESLKKDYEAVMKERNDLSDKFRALKEDRDIWVRNNGEKQAEIAELKKQLDGALEAKKAVDDSRYKWAQKWLSTKQNLETKLNEAEVKYRRLEKEHEELTIENKKLQDGIRDIGYEQGQTDLWNMLQNVKDMQPNEFDTECECLGDVIDMDLEDFKETYDKWEEEQKKESEEADKQHVEYMRSYLNRYCVGRLCFNCPLYDASKPVTSCLFSKLTDEEIEKRYNKAIESECKKIPVPVRARLPQPWECTIEGNFEINKDILNVVCGVKSEEEDHELEYGDAVRLYWRDYDYMYIGPDEKEETLVRLFDPKNRGCKIIICDEDDLRKIWKDKK